ncbi:MAG TPA: tripartite tricarboxylate transporter substrate-binding protein [Hyphomicrobiaceae bacterium]
MELSRTALGSGAMPGKRFGVSKQALKGAAAATAFALALIQGGGFQAAAADDWPNETLRMVIPSGPGGGTDTIARGLQKFLSEELGTSIRAENLPGANHALGAQAVAKSGSDCNTILAIYEPSLVTMAVADAGLDFSYDDFYPLGGIIVEPFAILVPNNSRFKDWQSLWNEIVKHPGEVRVAITSWFDVTTVHLLEMEEQLGVKFNIIRYDGGSAGRAALLAGETDFGYHILFGSRGVWDDTRTLAHFNATKLHPRGDISTLVDNSPDLKDLVDAKLTDTVLTFSLYVTSGCHSENPERYNKLLNALRNVIDDPAYHETLKELNMESGLLGVLGDDFFNIYKSMRPELEETINRLVVPRLGN